MPLGITGRTYVSGSYLWWEDNESTIDDRRNPAPQGYKFLGALPSSSIFAGQSPGRIWVASGSGDTGLYYSDAAGVTRVIYGVKRNPATTSPLGRIYVHRVNKAWTWEPIQPATDLFWTTLSGSTITWYSTRNDTSVNPLQDIELNISTYGDDGAQVSLYQAGTTNLYRSNFDIYVEGMVIEWYTSSNCTYDTLIGAQVYQQEVKVVIPAGISSVYICPDENNGGQTTKKYYAYPNVNECPSVLINNISQANSWKVLPYYAGLTPLISVYTGSTLTTASYTLGGLYYTSSTAIGTQGTLHYEVYNMPASSSTGTYWVLPPLSIGVDRVEVSFSGRVCSTTGGTGGCSAGSASCAGTCYAIASQECCGTTIINPNTTGCCNGTTYTLDGSQLCCGGSLFTYGPGNYSICCGSTACAWVDGNEICVNGACNNGSQP